MLLRPIERIVLETCRFANENPLAKRLQHIYHMEFGRRWVTAFTKNLTHPEGVEAAAALRPEQGVLIAANHRSFFDQYVIMALLLGRAPWAQRVFFPVRSNFFYESLAGLAVNLIIGGLVMYPPIFRQPERSELNKLALERIIELAGEPGVVIGMHPEGTRGKGPDPYQLLPAQPGVGQIIMRGRPLVLPVFVNGLGNDLPEQILSNFRDGDRRGDPIVVVFGRPVEFGDMLDKTPRPAQYKRVSDRVLAEIRKLGEREREIRAGL